MRVYNIPKLERIISRYKMYGQREPDQHLAFCVGQESLKDAIQVAAKAVDGNNKTHFHQRRVGRSELNNWAEKLGTFEEIFEKSTTFDEVFATVDKANTENIGELTVFDTAFRIGNFLKLFPEKIYLHSGTRKGAEQLLGDLEGKKSLLLEDFPAPFQEAAITPTDIEEILYIYRDEIEYCVKSKG
jgi:hypothetical protein